MAEKVFVFGVIPELTFQVAASRILFVHFHLLTAEACSEPFQTSKSAFAYPIFQFAYDFKLLTIY